MEGVPIVEQLAGVVLTRLLDDLASPEPLGLVERQSAALDVGRVVRLEQERALAHPLHPSIGQARRFQEASRPLDGRQGLGHDIADRETGCEAGQRYSPPGNARCAGGASSG